MESIIRISNWLADYTGAPDYPSVIQEFTSTRRVNGINGYFDINYLFDETMLNNTTAKQTSVINNNNDNNIIVDGASNIFRIWVGLSFSESTH